MDAASPTPRIHVFLSSADVSASGHLITAAQAKWVGALLLVDDNKTAARN
jgi:hypothetical protein